MRTARRALVLPTLVALLLGAATTVHADFKESYRAGIEAVDAEDWDAVVRHMQAAIADRSSAGTKVNIYGMRFVPYMPYYHLGLAQYKLQNCEATVEALEQSLAEGVVQEDRDRLTRLESMLSDCRGVLASRAPPTPNPAVVTAVDDAETAVQRAESALGQLQRQIASPDPATVWRANADLRRQSSTAEQAIADARRLLAEGREQGSLEQLTQARDEAAGATRTLQSLSSEVRRLANVERQRREEEERRRLEAERRQRLIEEIQRLRQDGQSVLDASENVSGGALAGRVTALTGTLETAAGDLADAPLEELETLRDRLARSITEVESEIARVQSLPTPTPRPSPTATPRPALPTPTAPAERPTVPPAEDGVPALLRDGAAAFLAARYENAVDLLQQVDAATPRQRLAQHVLLAAAQFALSRTEGNPERISAASASVREVTEIDPQFEPDPIDFSPAFRDFFASIEP